jgi:NAD(P)-dependent dehydrogenase (short-subunit alcohol dehydrogenase family)
MDLGLEDRICLVTGSTAGIGLETARLLTAEGARVVVNGRDPDRVQQARAEAGAALGVACDLSEPGAAEALVAETTEALGPVACLVNNVGEAYQVGFEELTDEQWDAMWQLNVMSYVRCIRAVLPGMKEAKAGTIVNVSSTAGKRPSTGMPNYSVTKAAVLSPRGRPLCQARDPLQCRRAWPDGDSCVACRRRSGRPASSCFY